MKLALLSLSVALAAPPKPALAVDPSQVEQDGPVREAAEASPSQEAIIQALSVREPAPTCGGLAALSAAPADDLAWVVTNVTSPPWAGMKAAECLVLEHTEAARPLIDAWVTDPRLKGLGWVVLKHLDAMPRPMALEIAQLAVDKGPDPAGARRRIRRSKVPEIQALGAE
jgi:hypothetical protein